MGYGNYLFGDIIHDLMSTDDVIYRYNHFYQVLGILIALWIAYSFYIFMGDMEYAQNKRGFLDTHIRLFREHMIIVHSLFLSIGLTMTAGAFSRRRLIRLINELSIMSTLGELLHIYHNVLPIIMGKRVAANSILKFINIPDSVVKYFAYILTGLFTLMHIYFRSTPFYIYMLALLFVLTAPSAFDTLSDICVELFRLYKCACWTFGIASYFYIVQNFIVLSLSEVSTINIASSYFPKARFNYLNLVWIINIVASINLLIQHLKACMARVMNIAVIVAPGVQYLFFPRIDLITKQ
jgi:hypothetical protein